MESPIVPSVGRVVLVHGPGTGAEKGRHVPGLVQRVWSNNCLNIAVMTDDGCKIFTSIMYDENEPNTHMSWFWMPYQLQADASRQAPISNESNS